mmetsp:Transcript_29138/g.38834  ORF Transcript_29138/g.38834 Transcript_29138/m.38834 type:complete len:220 (+) Transcript_29138:226-885(+)
MVVTLEFSLSLSLSSKKPQSSSFKNLLRINLHSGNTMINIITISRFTIPNTPRNNRFTHSSPTTTTTQRSFITIPRRPPQNPSRLLHIKHILMTTPFQLRQILKIRLGSFRMRHVQMIFIVIFVVILRLYVRIGGRAHGRGCGCDGGNHPVFSSSPIDNVVRVVVVILEMFHDGGDGGTNVVDGVHDAIVVTVRGMEVIVLMVLMTVVLNGWNGIECGT